MEGSSKPMTPITIFKKEAYSKMEGEMEME